MRAAPNAFGVRAIAPAARAGSVDLAQCLGGSQIVDCFSAAALTSIGNVAGAAIVAPGLLSATVVGSTVTLNWAAPADAVTSYTIEAGSSPGLSNLASISTGNAATSYNAPGVGAGTYYVRVRAVGPGGTSAPSNEVVVVVGGGPCAVPGGLQLTLTGNSGGSVSLAWTTPSGAPTTYILEAGSGPGLANLANSNLGSTATTYTANGVGAGTYYVRVRARNSCGTGPASNEVVVTVSSAAPVPSGPPAFLLQGWIWVIAPNSVRTYDFTQLASNGVQTVEIRTWQYIGTLGWLSNQLFSYNAFAATSTSIFIQAATGFQEAYDILDRNAFSMLLFDRRTGQQIVWYNCSASGWPTVIFFSNRGCVP